MAGLRFDPSIKASDILVAVAMLGAAWGAYAAMDKRVALVEAAQVSAQATVNEVRSDVKEIRNTVNEIRARGAEHAYR